MPARRTSDRPVRQTSAGSHRRGRPLMVDLGPAVPPVRRVVTALARRFNQICVTMVADSVAAADLTPLQFAVLAYLNKRDGQCGIDQNSLAARLGIERSHVSLLVEELGTRGLVDRQVNGADRRARVLQLTCEREVLLDLLLRIIRRNGAYARPGAGRRKRGSCLPSANKDRSPLSSGRKD